VERQRECEQAVTVVGAHRMAAAEHRDPGVAGGRVQLGEARALGEAPRERMLARPRADDEHLHAPSLLAPLRDVRVRTTLRLEPTPALLVGIVPLAAQDPDCE